MNNIKQYTPSPLTLAVVVSVAVVYFTQTMIFECTPYEALEVIAGLALIAGVGAGFFSLLLAYDKWRNEN